ncbi:hypothetical protein M9H77_30128 [Catharanthus roseus]|uniref:Uncharacterized protein n=1 Tax=Catharanthus roseus TaxID=4058 RepID=A0ACB9ZX95_CATRO|nr:hypothetical protein M9H77_30128 [Catharanthus roseus]
MFCNIAIELGREEKTKAAGNTACSSLDLSSAVSAKKCKHRNNGDLTWVPTLTFFVGLTGHLCPPTVSVMAVKRAVVPLKTFKDIVSPMKLLRPIYMGENELDANVRVEFSTVMANDALTSIFDWECELIGLEEGYYLVHFRSKKDYDRVLYGGPWVVLGNYLTVAKWQPNFPLPQDKILSTMVWLCFPEIPIEFFQDSLLMRIVLFFSRPWRSFLGEIIKPLELPKKPIRRWETHKVKPMATSTAVSAPVSTRADNPHAERDEGNQAPTQPVKKPLEHGIPTQEWRESSQRGVAVRPFGRISWGRIRLIWWIWDTLKAKLEGILNPFGANGPFGSAHDKGKQLLGLEDAIVGLKKIWTRSKPQQTQPMSKIKKGLGLEHHPSLLERASQEKGVIRWTWVSLGLNYLGKIEVVLLFNEVEDLKGFKIKRLAPRGSLEELKGFNCLACHTLLCKGGYDAHQDFGKFLRNTGKISQLQGRFKIDMRDRKGPNKLKSEGSTMKRKFDTGQKGKGIQWRECEGYGYIQAKCVNTLKKKRSMNTTFRDDEKCDYEDEREHCFY